MKKKQKPRNERAVSSINWSIGEALGKLYVTEKFPPAAKKSAEEMIDNIISAFKSRIIELSWMNKQTKDKAIEKLEKINVKVGYPDEWKDFSKLKIEPISNGGTFFENKLNLSKWSRQRNIDKLNKKVNKEEWYMSPQIVNAYYSPLNNEIVFPQPYYNHHFMITKLIPLLITVELVQSLVMRYHMHLMIQVLNLMVMET